MIEIRVDDGELKGLLNRLSGRLKNMSPAMRAISGIMHDAVEENFAQGGVLSGNHRNGWKNMAGKH